MTSTYTTTRFAFGGAGGARPTTASAAPAVLDDQGPKGIWSRVRSTLRARFDDTTYANWIAGLEFVAEVDGEILISAPGEFERERVSSAYGHAIRQAWKAADPKSRQIRIEARTAIAADVLALSLEAEKACEATPAEAHEAMAAPAVAPPVEPTLPGETAVSLDDFVVGESNRIAYNLSRRIAAGQVGAQVVTLMGPNGVGKTMLLRGIESAMVAAHGRDSVLYVSAEDFLVAFIEGVKRRDTSDLRAMMRSARVVLMDDFHFICSKPGTLGEFFSHLRANIANGRTVVIASDQSLTQQEQLDSRMRDELMGGIVASIDMPDRTLRLEIARAAVRQCAAQDARFEFPDQWLEQIADRAQTTGRVISGVITSVFFSTTAADLPLSWAVVEDMIQRKVGVAGTGVKAPKFDTIKDVTARMYNVTKQDLESECRKRIFAQPRQYAMYLCRKLTEGSYPQIGRHFGGRDHTTVLFAFRKINRLVANDPSIAEQMRVLEARVLADPRNNR